LVRLCLVGCDVHDAPADARRGDGVGQDDDGLPPGTALDPRAGVAGLIGRPVAQPLPRAQSPEQVAGHESDGRGDDAHHHDHRIPIVDSCSTRSDVSVAARLRWLPIRTPSLCSRSSWSSPAIRSTHFLGT
jgi:hypothetical protein